MDTVATANAGFIEHRLELLPYTARLLERTKSRSQIGDEMESITHCAERFANGYSLKFLTLCCIGTRHFCDLLHDRAVLADESVDHWTTIFANKIGDLIQLRQPSLEAFAGDDRDQAEKYFQSISFRLSLCNKMSEGLDVTRDLLEGEAEKTSRETGLLQSPYIDGLELVPALGARDLNLVNDPELFLCWKATRFLQHKLLFLLVELSHEAGPEWESARDHVSMATKAHEYAIELWVTAVGGGEGLKRRSSVTQDIARWANDLNKRFNRDVVQSMQGFRSDNHEAEPVQLSELERRTADLILSVRKELLRYCCEAREVEKLLRPAMSNELIAAWRLAYGHSSRLRESDVFEDLTLLDPSTFSSNEEREQYLARIIEEVSCLQWSGDMLLNWIHVVLIERLTLNGRATPTEQIAVRLFRILVQGDVPSVKKAFTWALNAKISDRIALGETLLMWTGTLLAECAKRDMEGLVWLELSNELISDEPSRGQLDSYKGSLAACLFAAGTVTIAETPDVIFTIKSHLKKLLSSVRDDERRYVVRHIVDSITEYFPLEGGKVGFFRLCGLRSLITADPSVWADNSILLRVISNAVRHYQNQVA